ncbi:hypothetical protein O0I10_010849 [Lichtheimia ornata]|uniref:Rho-GAP domain-containing protein n=1 Tax=Lichtheimia ornata TaxID=688661 RepID=A0AAD7UUW1_9FUNG|nr:uncharacterized protein O0I10_010849 [Lichtheimia ornata]KAJ8653521.1 hypothetical protein O0I10_010849 [Lichtheimia ornata]
MSNAPFPSKHSSILSFDLVCHLLNLPSWYEPISDKELEQIVLSQSTDIEILSQKTNDELARFIIYLRQRVELEEGYQNSLDRILHNLELPACDPDMATGIHKAFAAHVEVDTQQRSARTHYIQTMKGQLQRLAELKEKHDKSRRHHRKAMRGVAQQYLKTRLRDLPAARDAYEHKWQDIERTQAMSPTTATPSTPTSGGSHGFKGVMSMLPPATPKSGNQDHDPQQHASPEKANPTVSRSATMGVVGSKKPSIDLPSTPMTPTSTQRKLERFMKQFSTFNQDPSRITAKTARLKNEAIEADKHYRKTVLRLNHLRGRQSAVNDAARRAIQAQFEENARSIKDATQIIVKAETGTLDDIKHHLRRAEELLTSIDPTRDPALYDTLVHPEKYPVPDPVYYQNHHVGECPYMLFGISLIDYARQYRRSPPLLITRCIECIEQQEGLAKEGIYRVSGKQTHIDKLKSAFERDEPNVVPGKDDVPGDVYSVASLLKIFLRELSSPVFPFKLSDRITYSQIPDKQLRLMNLLTRLIKLPPPNYDTLKAVIEHLARLIALAEKNKMSAQNISLVFTPALFHDHNQAQRSPGEWYNDCVIEDLVMNCETLFADKDLRGASAITGVIDYGFEHLYEDHDDENLYNYDNDSPSTTSTFSILEQSLSDDESNKDAVVDENSNKDKDADDTTLLVCDTTTSPEEKRKSRKAHGLKVDTKPPEEEQEMTSSTREHDQPPPQQPQEQVPFATTINSATIPTSTSWLNQDPEIDNKKAAAVPPPLQRSATIGGGAISRHRSRQKFSKRIN